MTALHRAATLAVLLTAAPALASAAPSPPVHVRGTIVSVSPTAATIRAGARTTLVALTPAARILGVAPSSLANVAPGTYIGTTVSPQPDGTLQAREVHLFPAAMKGTGEGYYPWDAQRGSMMANATVSHVAGARGSMMANATVQHVGAVAGGRTVVLTYAGGTKTVTVSPTTPIVAIDPAAKNLLRPGAHVFVIATRTANGLTARAVLVGENGLVPPM